MAHVSLRINARIYTPRTVSVYRSVVQDLLHTNSSRLLQLLDVGCQDGNTVVVCTCAAVSSMGTGVLVGLLVLGEAMPVTPAARALRLASWLAITAGVAGLANGSGNPQDLFRSHYGSQVAQYCMVEGVLFDVISRSCKG